MQPNPIGLALRNRHAGHDTLVWARPDLQAPENFILTSPAFEHGAAIPERHRGRLFGANISPALAPLSDGSMPTVSACVAGVLRGASGSWTMSTSSAVSGRGVVHGELLRERGEAQRPLGETHQRPYPPAPAAQRQGFAKLGRRVVGADELPENGLTNPSPTPGLKHGKGPLGRLGRVHQRPRLTRELPLRRGLHQQIIEHLYNYILVSISQVLAINQGALS